jgi:hypothetical protein
MSNEFEAEKDLALSDEDAENVLGGKKRKKHAAPTHKVQVIYSPGASGADQPTQYVTGNLGNDDCSDGSEPTAS